MTLLLARGMTIGQVQTVLGYASGRLMGDLYTHYTHEIAGRAAAEMEAKLTATNRNRQARSGAVSFAVKPGNWTGRP